MARSPAKTERSSLWTQRREIRRTVLELSAKGALENRPATNLRVVIELAQVVMQPDSAAPGDSGCSDIVHRRSSLSVGDRTPTGGNRPMTQGRPLRGFDSGRSYTT